MLVRNDNVYTDMHKFLLKFLGDKIHRIFEQFSIFSLPTSIYTNLREVISNSITQNIASSSLITSILNEVGWSPDDNYMLIVLTNSSSAVKNQIHKMVCSQLELLFPESCAILYNDTVVLLINFTQCKRSEYIIHKNLAIFLRENLFKAGISKHFHSFSDIRFAHEEASIALRIGNIKNNMLWYYRFTDYILDYIVEQTSINLPKKSLCHESILLLRQYDMDYDTNYYQVLRTFIDKKYNVTHAADALFIHRTTFLKYLDKIMQITSLNLDNWNTRLHLMLSYQYLDETN